MKLTKIMEKALINLFEHKTYFKTHCHSSWQPFEKCDKKYYICQKTISSLETRGLILTYRDTDTSSDVAKITKEGEDLIKSLFKESQTVCKEPIFKKSFCKRDIPKEN